MANPRAIAAAIGANPVAVRSQPEIQSVAKASCVDGCCRCGGWRCAGCEGPQRPRAGTKPCSVVLECETSTEGHTALITCLEYRRGCVYTGSIDGALRAQVHFARC